MRVVIYLLPFFLVFLVSPIVLSFWWAHALISIFVLWNISKLSKYYLFWFLFFTVVLFSTETRLSLEYFLIASSLIAFSISDAWQSVSRKNKSLILILIFFGFFIVDYINYGWVEKGSAIMLLPVFLATYFPLSKLNFKITQNSMNKASIYMTSFLVILFSNKRTTLLGYLASLKNLFSRKVLVFFSLLILGLSFLVKDNLTNFYRKSIEPRTLIWQAAAKGFQDKPIFGHGFGTFTLDFPPYRMQNPGVIGAQETEYVVHGHSQIFHSLFEMGILGAFIFIALLVLIFKYANNAFLPFLVISLFNVSFQSFTQIFLLALIFNPFENNEKIFAKIEKGKFRKVLQIVLVVFASIVMLMSSLAHYFFDQNQVSKAIRIDSLHPLYHFSRGARKINQDIEKSQRDLKRAVELAPGVGYMRGFYAATLLGTGNLEEAKLHIEKSLKQMGKDPYLLILSSFINRDNKKLAENQYNEALKLNPDLEFLLKDSSYSADEFIGVRSSNPRIMSFYRMGRKIYLPLPYVGIE